ncbi:hypothetical protein LTS17_006394 [Exophiala oligosperma]
MRLLMRRADGTITITHPFPEDTPPYAILSHTWNADFGQEVTLEEVEAGTNKSKAGWEKVHFCAERAWKDGLQYFWIDTCCINKANSVEMQNTINSMFRWYQRATRCYVYLSDVSSCSDNLYPHIEPAWQAAFKASRWFTRGWTLQELIAPNSVDFFNSCGERLGDKVSLRTVIEDVTSVPGNALSGHALSDFSISDRFSWADRRQTSIEEDMAYSLMGIFDVSMPILYGEGGANAHRRLEDEIHRSYKDMNGDQFEVALDLSTMPQRAPFIAREEELREMHKVLYGHKFRSTVVLQGLGGMGKTQLAIEYTRRHIRSYSAIFWLNANDTESLSKSLQGIVRQILKIHPSTVELAGVEFDGDFKQILAAIVAWLEIPGNTRWLLIYDDLQSLEDDSSEDVLIRRLLPGSDHGSVIFTTRSANIWSIGPVIRVSRLSKVEHSLEILLRASGRTSTQKDMMDDDAIALVHALSGSPLALSTAGAYFEKTSTSYRDYLRLYRETLADLQTEYRLSDSYLERPLYTTWQISHNRIQQQNPFSANVLKLWAYFDPHDLWFELLRHGRSTNQLWIEEMTRDELEFEETLRLLHAFSLVEPSSLHDQYGWSGHTMPISVHRWTTSVLNKEWDESLAQLALTCVALEVPSTDEDSWWIRQRRLLQHAGRLERFIVAGKMKTTRMEWALSRLGGLFAQQGMLAEAEAMYERALQGQESLGEQQTLIIATISSLGSVYANRGRLAEAERMFCRALQGYKEASGESSTLETFINLGNVYADQGKLAEAERMYIRALQGYEETLGPEHTSTLSTVNNLGNVYADQGKLVEAEGMYIRVLQGYEKALGPEHTSTLSTVNNLGLLYADQGKLAEAERLYIRALQGYKETLGSEHTSTLSTVNNLGNVYADQGKLAEAEGMYIQVLQGYKKALGPEHTSTLSTVNNLGLLYANQGKLAEAERMYIRALQGYEETLGPEHTSTLSTVNNLGLLYANQGKLVEAEQMYLQALQAKEKALGKDHTSTLDTLNNLGSLYTGQGRLEKAAAMQQEVLSKRQQILGMEHPDTISAMNNLANTLTEQGRLENAAAMQQEVLSKRQRILGMEHPDTISAMNNLANTLSERGRLKEAVAMKQEVLSKRQRILGKEHPDTMIAMNNLAKTLGDEGRLEEASLLLTEAVHSMERVLGDQHPQTILAKRTLTKILHDQRALDRQIDVETSFKTTCKLATMAIGEGAPQHSEPT